MSNTGYEEIADQLYNLVDNDRDKINSFLAAQASPKEQEKKQIETWFGQNVKDQELSDLLDTGQTKAKFIDWLAGNDGFDFFLNQNQKENPEPGQGQGHPTDQIRKDIEDEDDSIYTGAYDSSSNVVDYSSDKIDDEDEIAFALDAMEKDPDLDVTFDIVDDGSDDDTYYEDDSSDELESEDQGSGRKKIHLDHHVNKIVEKMDDDEVIDRSMRDKYYVVKKDEFKTSDKRDKFEDELDKLRCSYYSFPGPSLTTKVYHSNEVELNRLFEKLEMKCRCKDIKHYVWEEKQKMKQGLAKAKQDKEVQESLVNFKSGLLGSEYQEAQDIEKFSHDLSENFKIISDIKEIHKGKRIRVFLEDNSNIRLIESFGLEKGYYPTSHKYYINQNRDRASVDFVKNMKKSIEMIESNNKKDLDELDRYLLEGKVTWEYPTFEEFLTSICHEDLEKISKEKSIALYEEFSRFYFIVGLNEGLIKSYGLEVLMKAIEKKLDRKYDFQLTEKDHKINLHVNNCDPSEIKEILKPILSLTGYFILLDFMIPGITYEAWIEALYDKNVTNEIYDNFDCLYHISPSILANKIINIGLVQKSKNKISRYPDRVYLFKLYDLERFKKFVRKSSEREEQPKEWTILKIELDPLKRMTFYRDPNYKDDSAIFTYSNTSPKNIEIIGEFTI